MDTLQDTLRRKIDEGIKKRRQSEEEYLTAHGVDRKTIDAYMESRYGIDDETEDEIRNILEMEEDDDEYYTGSDYRKIAIKNTPRSANGKYRCRKCKKYFDLCDMDADHIVPKSRGGSNSSYNLQLICKHCNRSKQDDMSDTYEDLAYRQRELAQQHAEDLIFSNYVEKELRKRDEPTESEKIVSKIYGRFKK